jgi:hypothetical protein
MQYIHVKNLETFHPGYKDRELKWAKIYFNIIQGDFETEMLNEIDRGRFISFILLELQAKKPIPIDDAYFIRKGFDVKKRPISLTLKMLHNFINIVNDEKQNLCTRIDKNREEESREEESTVTHIPVTEVLEFHPLQEWIKAELQNVSKIEKQLSKEDCERLLIDFNGNIIKDILTQMENKKDLTKKYKSVNLTLRNWIKLSLERSNGRSGKHQGSGATSDELASVVAKHQFGTKPD